MLKEKGSVRYYFKEDCTNLIRVDFHGSKEIPTGTYNSILKSSWIKKNNGKYMIDLDYSLIIEATEEPDFFGYYSPELEGFSGVGNSVEDCIYKAKWGMKEHLELMKEKNLPIPERNHPIRIIIQNQSELIAV